MTARSTLETKPRIALIGGGIHAVVVTDCIRRAGRADVCGYSDVAGHDAENMMRMSVPYVGDDRRLVDLIKARIIDGAILGIAGLEHSKCRRSIVDQLDGFVPRWWTAIHPTSAIAPTVHIEPGAVVFAGAIINPLAKIGLHAVINTGAVVEHHCTIGDFAVVSPHSTLCGDVHVGRGAFIGAGAVVITGVRIGENSVVGAGAVVIRDVPSNAVVVGNPAAAIESGSGGRHTSSRSNVSHCST
jgi:UDP-perosamine 4-acetyltransferase